MPPMKNETIATIVISVKKNDLSGKSTFLVNYQKIPQSTAAIVSLPIRTKKATTSFAK